MDEKELIKKGLVCPYCGKDSELVPGTEIYSKDYGRLMRICRPCQAWVGCHADSEEAMGRLANEELRYWKKLAHSAFDPLWEKAAINLIWNKYIPNVNNRTKAYMWLADQLSLDMDDCHIGMFDIEYCKKVIAVCKRYTDALSFLLTKKEEDVE